MIRMSAEKMHRVFSLYQQSGYYFTQAHYPVLQTVQCHRSRRVTAENAGHSVTAVYFSDKANFYISGSRSRSYRPSSGEGNLPWCSLKTSRPSDVIR